MHGCGVQQLPGICPTSAGSISRIAVSILRTCVSPQMDGGKGRTKLISFRTPLNK